MDYLILKIIVCLGLAFLLGLVIGWVIRHLSCNQHQHHLSGELLAHKQSLRQFENDANYARKEAQANQQRVEEMQEQIGALKEKLHAVQPSGSSRIQGAMVSGASQSLGLQDLKNDLNLARADRDHLNLKLRDRQREISLLSQEVQSLKGELGKLGANVPPGTTKSGASAFAMVGATAVGAAAGLSETAEPLPSSTTAPEPATNRIATASAETTSAGHEAGRDAPVSEPATPSQASELSPNTSAAYQDTKPATRTVAASVLAANLKLDPETLKSSYKVEEILGIGKGYGKRLRGIGVATTMQMLEHGQSEAGLAEIAKVTRVDKHEAEGWVRMSDLLRVPGVRGQFAGLLFKSEVDSVEALARQTPAALTQRMIEANEREHCSSLKPDEAEVAYWIAAAAEIPAGLK